MHNDLWPAIPVYILVHMHGTFCFWKQHKP